MLSASFLPSLARASAVLPWARAAHCRTTLAVRAASLTVRNPARAVHGAAGVGQLDLGGLFGDEEPAAPNTDFDLVVIGGGSGGLACGREAAALNKRVAVLDFVDPSPRGSKWGLGGTCVNVGCIPKKIMHTAGLVGQALVDAPSLGWQVDAKPSHDWQQLRTTVQNYVRSSNFGYVSALMKEGVEYYNARGSLLDRNTVKAVQASGKTIELKAKHVVVSVGTRPTYLDIPGAELCITSDDLFSLPSAPGKTLVVGGAYVALECAGFLTEIGADATLMARSILLRGFDRQMADMVGEHMARHGTKFIMETVPSSVHKTDDGRLRVEWTDRSTGTMMSDTFDTVMLAVGRHAVTAGIGLEPVGVQVAQNGKIVAAGDGVLSETSTVDNIFAIGDVLDGRPELTPVAAQAGRLLAQRLYAGSSTPMDYDKVPTTVFTPMEYACIGATEEAAIAQEGEDNIEVYHVVHQPLEMAAVHRSAPDGTEDTCYCKLVCERESGRVLGIHILGPSAGEVMQGFAVAMRLGATKADFDSTVGIHPTHAEEIVGLDRTKRSGVDPVKTSC